MQAWWKKAIGYEIYPSSFYDSNNDGIGDIRGIIEKLDYLTFLGVDLLWITPFFVSPMDDNGYDVKDYCHVDPSFGSDEDFKELLTKAHERGMHVIIDFVLNHTSDEHPWFMEAKQGDNDKKDYYLVKEGRKDEKGNVTPPNNWSGFFSDSAWTKMENEEDLYYMHIFSKKMPDLNWENENMRNEMYEIAKFWLDQGVDGFRLDAVAHLAKDLTYRDSNRNINENGLAEDWSRFSNLPRVFSHLREMKQKVLKNYDCVSIGEVGGGVSPRQALQYVNQQNGPLDMVFNFDAVWVHGSYGNEHKPHELVADVKRLKEVFYMWIETYGEQAWYPLYWTNHDHPRVLSHYGNVKYRKESAKMLGAVLLFMGGTPFIYNGEEIGMSNVTYQNLEEFKDVSAQNYIKANQDSVSEEEMLAHLCEASRVNARTPMQWNAEKYAGFSSVKPALKVNDNYVDVNVEQQMKDSDSILYFYRNAISLRKGRLQDVVLNGNIQFVDMANEDIFAYVKATRDMKLMVIANFKDKVVDFSYPYDVKEVVMQNYEKLQFHKRNITLRPYECVVFIVE